MYSAEQLKTGLLGLIGWRQNRDTDGLQLQGMTTGTSGMYYNDVHPLLTFDNLLSIGPDLAVLSDVTADQEQAFTDWLQEKTEAGIINAVQDWLDYKFPRRTAKNLLERRQLWQTAPGNTVQDENRGLLVGIELVPKRSRDLKMKIEQVGLQFEQNQNVTIYLFSATSSTSLQSTTIDYQAGGGVQWAEVNWEVDGTGAYWLAYDQDAVTGRSVNGTYDWFDMHASSQNMPGANMVLATPFTADATPSALWDISRNAYNYDTNFGLNVKLTVGCDYTNLILEQAELFKTLISLHVAAVLLGEMAYNSNARLNRNQAIVDRNQVLFELHGDTQSPRPMGILHRIEKARETISLDMQQLDKHCLPCRRRGVRYTVV